MSAMEPEARHELPAGKDLTPEETQLIPEVKPLRAETKQGRYAAEEAVVSVRSVRSGEDLQLWFTGSIPGSPLGPRTDVQPGMDAGCSHVAEFHLELVSVSHGPAVSHDQAAYQPDHQVQRAWAALSASLVPGQRLRFLHIGEGAQSQARGYRMLIAGQGFARGADRATTLARRLMTELRVALALIAPCLGFRDTSANADLRPWEWAQAVQLQPAALSVLPSAVPADGCATVFVSDAVRLPLPVRATLQALAGGVAALASSPEKVAVQVDLFPVFLDEGSRKHVQELACRLLDTPLARLAVVDSEDRCQPASAAMAQAVDVALREWMHRGTGLQMRVCARCPDGSTPTATVLNLIGEELWQGRPFSLTTAEDSNPPVEFKGCLDLARLILSSHPWPPLLPDPQHLLARGLRFHQHRQPGGLPIEGAVLGYMPGAFTDATVRLHEVAWSRHLHVLGASGSGKTRLLQQLIADRLRRGHGLILLDPHGDLFEAAHADCPPWREGDLVSLDFGDFAHAPALNLLQCHGDRVDVQRTFLIHALCETFLQMYPENKDAFGPMFFTYLTYAARLALQDTAFKATVLDVPRVFSEPAFRRGLIERCSDVDVRSFWQGVAQRAGGDASLDKLAPHIVAKFVDLQQPPMRAFLGQAESSIDLRAIMDAGKPLLINLAKGILGERQSRFLGLLLTSRILAAVLSRAELPADQRKTCHLVVDEFGSMLTPAFEGMLSEGRKFGLSAVLAHQHMAQLPPALAQSVLTNTGSRIVMRVGADDAQMLARWVAPEFGAQDLMTLPDRYAVARLQVPGGVTPPFLMHTLDCPDAPQDSASRARFEALRASSRLRYCRPVAEVEREIARVRAAVPPPTATRNTQAVAEVARAVSATAAPDRP